MADTNIYFTLPSGQKYPCMGIGTWQSKPNEIVEAIKTAIDIGYRQIDCALLYDNESGIGDAVRAKIAEGTITREDIIITSKLWNTYHHKDNVLKGIQKSLANFKLDYLDLYLIHWPVALKYGEDHLPRHVDGSLVFEDDDLVDTWQAMEVLVSSGLVKNIGVSNFNISQIQRILDIPNKVPIANLQLELHPYLDQDELIKFCKSKGISVTAYGPLGSPDCIKSEICASEVLPLLQDPVVNKIAKAHGVGPAAVLIRYCLEKGCAVIPKSANFARIKENYLARNLKLSKEDMKQLTQLNKNYRYFPLPMFKDSKFYPF